MSNIINQDNQVATQTNAFVEIEKSRQLGEIQAALIMASKCPRDEIQCEQRILESCKRFSFAENALYAYPRGGETISGLGIRAAEMMARNWKNMKFGFVEKNNDGEKSQVESFAWDLQNNIMETRTFDVYHKVQLKNKSYKILTDVRERYENMANQAARRTRACILALIPGEIKDAVQEHCNKTLQLGQKAEPLIDRVRRMVTMFAEMGVTKELIEQRLGHDIELTNAKEIAELVQIFNSLKDGMTSRQDWFDLGKKIESSEKTKAVEQMILGTNEN